MKRIEQNNLKHTQISIPSSHSSQQALSTPHWGYQKYQVPKMSRLDQLLSRNQQIYQNMRNQLMEISRSNRNIDANINNIKPMYQSQQAQNYQEQPHDYNSYQQQYQEQHQQIAQNQQNSANSRSTYKQPYTFEQKSNSNDENSQSYHKITISRPRQKQSSSSNSKTSNNKTSTVQNRFTFNRGHVTNSSQSLSSLPSQNKNNFIYSLGDTLGSSYNGRAVPIHHNQKQIHNIEFSESDSSPIQSQKFASKQITNIYYAPKNQVYIDAPSYKYRKESEQRNVNDTPTNILSNSKSSKNESSKYPNLKQSQKKKKSSFMKKQGQFILVDPFKVSNQKEKIYQNQQNDKFQTFQQNQQNPPHTSPRAVEQKITNARNSSKSMLIYKKNYVEELHSDNQFNRQKNKNLSIIKNQDLRINIPSSSRLRQDTLNTNTNSSLPQKFSSIYIPFNRLYSSPILQQSKQKQLTLARRSRTHTTSNNLVNRIICGKKYKNINMINQQALLYQRIMKYVGEVEQVMRVKRIFSQVNNQNLWFQLRGKDSVDIGIIGGQNSLKKKIHYALIAHIYTDLLKIINNYYQVEQQTKRSVQKSQETFQQLEQTKSDKKNPKIIIGVQHQEQQSMNDPYVVRYQGQISKEIIQNQIVYGNIRAVIEAIFQCMKMKLPQNTQNNNNIPHRIRVTRLYLKVPAQQSNTQSQNQYITLHNTKIISTNKINLDLISKLQLDAIVWCVNPLFKYFDQTQNVLDCYTAYRAQLKPAFKDK